MTNSGASSPLAGVIANMNAAYEAVTGKQPTGFVCPVCLADVPTSRVTRAHAPAEAVGGHVTTYICADCNSILGRRYEAGAVSMIVRRRGVRMGEWVEDWRFGSDAPGRSSIKTKVVIKQDRSGKQEYHILGPKSGTAAHSRWVEEIELITRGGHDGRFEGKYPSNAVVHHAYVSWAFLALVSAVGYAFALSEPARLVANAMLTADLAVMGEAAVVKLDGVPEEPEFEPSYAVMLSTANDPSAPDAFGWRFGPVICIFPLRHDTSGSIYRTLGNVDKATGAWYAVNPDALGAYLADRGPAGRPGA